jgi:hypothetical protein
MHSTKGPLPVDQDPEAVNLPKSSGRGNSLAHVVLAVVLGGISAALAGQPGLSTTPGSLKRSPKRRPTTRIRWRIKVGLLTWRIYPALAEKERRR